MARPRKSGGSGSLDASVTADYRHTGVKRKNVPPATMAAEGTVPKVAKARYAYSPHLPPVLRFDGTGKADALPELLAEAGRRALRAEELKTLAEVLRRQEPWLEWAGKRESDGEGRGFLEVDPVALHIHERVSAQAVLKVAARQDVARDLFADPEQEYRDAVQFYRHDVDWSNRLILGDSLQVMSSLARREGLAGKVQMIYIDPPYGIKFASNFQPEVGKRDVKDKEEDLTREPEMVKAYRDTWNLGIHSYLAYLRDRLVAARELLTDSGSIFVQISDENVHLIRNLLDEVFGETNFASLITFRKKMMPLGADFTEAVSDYLLWYVRDAERAKVRPVFLPKDPVGDPAWSWAELSNGFRRRLTPEEFEGRASLPEDASLFQAISLLPAQYRPNQDYEVEWEGRRVGPPKNNCWKTDRMDRVIKANRAHASGETLRQVLLHADYPVSRLTNLWADAAPATGPQYVVQTNETVVARCIWLTTDPGDLVLDPTCGSGTTAFVAEQWGRRWITIDTSRVAVSIARQRLLTAKYDYYALRDEDAGISAGLKYRTVPHITLKSIAQNTNLDPIFARHEPILEERLKAANAALGRVTDAIRTRLLTKLVEKQRADGKRAVTDADRRRWELPKAGGGWEHWQVPFDTDPEWPEALRAAVGAYRKAWRAKMDEVNACISANAEQEELVDQPEVTKGVVRVSGPFTVESVQPPEVSLKPEDGKFAGEPEELGTMTVSETVEGWDATNLRAYLAQMHGHLKRDGVLFPKNKQKLFSRLDPLFESGRTDEFHAEGRWAASGEKDHDPDGAATVGVVFGPQYGPISARMVEDVIRPAARRYEDLVFAGFAFDGAAQEAIRAAAHPKLRIHMAHIRPDVNPGMAGLLKEQPGAQLFTVFGQPRVHAKKARSEWTVAMDGVDLYDPVNNVIVPTKADKVAAWFLDGDYDGRTFCITQAFFPDRGAWEKLARALKGVLDEERFTAMSGTVSLPFPAGKHRRAAVKVIDPRGNEVMTTVPLEG